MRASQTRWIGLAALALCSLVAYVTFTSVGVPPPMTLPMPPTMAPTMTLPMPPTMAPTMASNGPAARQPAAELAPRHGPTPSALAPGRPTETGAQVELTPYQGPVRDTERAALVREALIARKAMQADGASSGTVKGEQALEGYVARTMREHFLPLATACYETLLTSKPDAAGNVALEFSVLGDPAVGGVVVDVTLGPETTLTNSEFRTCITESMYAWVLDPPPGKDGSVAVKQSFELSP